MDRVKSFYKNNRFFRISIYLLLIFLFFSINYLGFKGSRVFISSLEGKGQNEFLMEEDTYILNLDPSTDIKYERINEKNLNDIYDYLEIKYDYSIFIGGYIEKLDNSYGMDISISYMDENYFNMRDFKIKEGDFSFPRDYESDKIPVLIGASLGEDYEVGQEIKIYNHILDRQANYVVGGILEDNESHSNIYAPDLKEYFNFSIIVPFYHGNLKESRIDFKLNGLMDLILLNSNEEKNMELGDLIREKIDLNFNFYRQGENDRDYNEYILPYYLINLIIILIFSILLISISYGLIKFSIDGGKMNFSDVGKKLYPSLIIVFLIKLLVFTIFVVFDRYESWTNKLTNSITMGFFGLIGMDYMGLLIIFILDLIIGLILIGIVNRKLDPKNQMG